MGTRSLLSIHRTPLRLVISNEYQPRNFPVKATTGMAGLSVEPLWKPKLLAAAAELHAFLRHCDIPKDSTYYNITMVLVKRIYGAIDECGDDWLTLEKKYFWGWPVEYILQITWKEVDVARKFNDDREWEIDPNMMKRIINEDVGVGRNKPGMITPWEQVVREDYDRRKKSLSHEEMAELKRMDTEKMARETAAYKERKERIKDDMERARGEMLRKFLGGRLKVDEDLRRMQPGSLYSGKTSEDLVRERKEVMSEKEREDKERAKREEGPVALNRMR